MIRYNPIIITGLNLNNSSPSTSVNQTISHHNQISGQSLPPLELEQTLALIMNSLEEHFLEFVANGFHRNLAARYFSRWVHSNQKIQIEGVAGSFLISGIDVDGYLVATQVDNPQEMISLEPDGNSFDMTKNLVHRKQY